MWACYLGTISDSYRENWSPHPVSCDHPDVFDVLDTRREILYRLDGAAAGRHFTDMIKVDWGGWAYKCTKEQLKAYSREAGMMRAVDQSIIDGLEDGVTYGIIDVELY
ncbi:MAG: hypothetical protein CW338_06385 [Clostridiales bacterium]|nr:hypothetical protein [Clostridiales bacterium]